MRLKVVTGRLRLTAMGHVVLLIAAGTVALASSTAQDWQPIELVFLLLVLAIGSDALTIDFRGIRISGSFLAIVLAMALLGPAPAAAIGVLATTVDALLTPRPWQRTLSNFAVWASFPVVGGLLVDALVTDPTPGGENALAFAVLVFVTFMVTNFLNFVLVAGSLQA